MVGRRNALPYGLVLPVLVIEVVFVLVPLVIGLYYSLHDGRFLRLGRFVWFDNYLRILASPEVWQAVVVTAIFSIFALFFTFIVGFALALRLERDTRLNVLGRVVVLVPYVISMLVGSMLLKWLFSADGGLTTLIFAPLGLGSTSILSDPDGAMAALVFNAVWRDCAFAMILLMAGLKSVPLHLYAAARADGASALYRFWRITLPLMRIPILITLVRLMIHFVNVLTFALVLTGGGPSGATNTIGLQLYSLGFRDYRFGEANALAFLVFLFNIVIIFLLIKLFERRREGRTT